MTGNPWLQARNILAIRLDNTGDVIMLAPALRALKETSPQARLTLLASPAGSKAASLLPWIDSTLVWRAVWQDAGKKERQMPHDPAREQEFIRYLESFHFDAALIFTSFSQTPHTPGYVCYLAGIPLRAGESTEFGGSVLSTEIRGTPLNLHQAERNLRLVESLGFIATDRRLTIAFPDDQRRLALTSLKQLGIDPEQPFILLHPGASARARRYPAERFGLVAHLLQRQGWPLLITGIERERELISQVRHVAPGIPALVDEISLATYAALIERAALVICNNTLPMHLADALRTPVLVLYSGTDYEEQWQPRDTQARLLRRATPCHPCYYFDCPLGLTCLDIPPEEVVTAAMEMLETRSTTQGRQAKSSALQGGRV